MSLTRRRIVTRVVFGALIGLVLGAIASINVVIFSGIEDGYEATPAQVFEENALVGTIAVLVLGAGPLLGVLVALRQPPPG